MEYPMVIIIAAYAAIVTAVLTLIGFVLKLFGQPKIELHRVKHYFVFRGRPIAWNVYAVVATLFTLYFLLVLSLVISLLQFSISFVAFIVLIVWALLGIWSPIILKYFDNKRVNVGLQVAFFLLATLTVILFWFVQYPEIQQPIFVTLLLVAVFVIFLVNSVYKRYRARKSGDKEEEERAKEMLDSVPAHVELSAAVSGEVTVSKLIYLLIKHSQQLNNLTIALIVLSVILAIATVVNIIIAFFR